MEGPEPEARRKVLKSLTYGVHILAAGEGEAAVAGTVTWLSQASFNPPLVMAAIKAGSRLHAAVEIAGRFALNVLREDQASIAAMFFKPSHIEGDRINGLRFEAGPQTGAPLLVDLPFWLEARILEAVRRGDHTVFVAEVIAAGVRAEGARALLLAATPWSYGG